MREPAQPQDPPPFSIQEGDSIRFAGTAGCDFQVQPIRYSSDGQRMAPVSDWELALAWTEASRRGPLRYPGVDQALPASGRTGWLLSTQSAGLRGASRASIMPCKSNLGERVCRLGREEPCDCGSLQ